MEVLLYVYDLSHGLARQMSMQFLGIQIDAVYHTSIVFSGTEYFFGQGIQMCRAGMSHHCRPMHVVNLGQTDLPVDVIEDYLEALRETYTAESYDLFMHNCNNFSHDMAQFLVGKGIPEHITNLPRQVLNTPFGRMLQPQLDASMRSVTQAPVPAKAKPNGHAVPVTTPKIPKSSPHSHDRLDLHLLEEDAATYFTSDLVQDAATFEEQLSAISHGSLSEAVHFVRQRAKKQSADIPLPDLAQLRDSLQALPSPLPEESLHAMLELQRLLLLDTRVSTFLVDDEMAKRTLVDLLDDVNSKQVVQPSLRNAALDVAANLFASKQTRRVAHQDPLLNGAVVELMTRDLLNQEAPDLQLSASRVAHNLCTTHFNWLKKARENNIDIDARAKDYFSDSRQIELAAALIEVLSVVQGNPTFTGNVITALGRLVCRAPIDGELLELCRSLEAGESVRGKRNCPGIDGALVDEVASLFS